MINIGIGVAWTFRKLSKYVSNLIYSFKERVYLDDGLFEAEQCLNEDLDELQGIGLLYPASLVITPNAVEEDKLFSIVPSDGSGDLTVTRATTATRVNSAGLIEQVPYNLLTYSNNFSNANWVKFSVTVASGQPGYDETSNAWLLSNTATSGAFLQQVVNVNVNNIFSLYLKRGTLNFAMFLTSGSTLAIFDLLNGTINSSIGGLATIESVGNGWYKCSLKPSVAGTNIRVYPGNNSGAPVGNIFIQDAQLENSLTAKEYFPTTDRLDIPRLDYTNSTCPSILIEPQRTNLLIRSEEFDNAAWVKTNVTVIANATISPNGGLNADKIISTATNSNHIVFNTPSSFVGSQSYNFSYYAKSAEYTKTAIRIGGPGYSIVNRAEINLSNGTIIYQQGFTSLQVQSVGNGWYRIQGTFVSASGLSANIQPLSDSYSVVLNNYESLGDGTSGIYIWGAQLEAGANATSYIPTVASTVTRNADVISKTGISSLIGQTEGTIFVDFIYDNNDVNVAEIISISDGTVSNRVYIGNVFSNNLSCNVTSLSSVQFTATTSFALIVGQRYKAAITYKLNDFAFYVNGSQIATHNIGTIPLTSRLAFDSGSGSSVFCKPIRLVSVYKTRLTNEECINLTTI